MSGWDQHNDQDLKDPFTWEDLKRATVITAVWVVGIIGGWLLIFLLLCWIFGGCI